MSKIISKFDTELVRTAVNKIAEPVIQTITPLGKNVLFEKDFHPIITNDGATIAKLIESDDEVEDLIIQLVKIGSLSTNQIAGDGTSTTILLTKKLVDIGTEMIDKGEKPMVLASKMKEAEKLILNSSKELVQDVSKDSWYDVALISASGDEEIAKNVVEIIDTAGLDGMIFINESKNSKTNIIKDTGYNLEEPMFDSVLGNIQSGQADYTNPYVFVTDKKLYHVEECREILEVGAKQGIRDFVIVARDFVGEAPNFFIANHLNKDVPLNILLIKYPTPDNDTTPLHDLATYLNVEIVSEKMGNIRGKLTQNHYSQAERVYSRGNKTILLSMDKVNPALTLLVEDLRQKKESDIKDDKVAKRLASLTAGTINLEVGGNTGPEVRELIYRYEDAINATRAAIRSGYVVGGGLTLFNSCKELHEDETVNKIQEELSIASIKQIADNCSEEFDVDKYGPRLGYNAKTGVFSDLEKDGIIEPYDVFQYSVKNAFSIARAILTSGFIIVNKIENDNN